MYKTNEVKTPVSLRERIVADARKRSAIEQAKVTKKAQIKKRKEARTDLLFVIFSITSFFIMMVLGIAFIVYFQ
ncbi:hypothetical protein [Peribacillus asahii]|uniref:hypothetical protein n=1 Tax=Peribacillus asahii TaxID=228899 RepID=UPI0020793164|nr:hypothetical protein [Peribacillus asahii]USK62348.1 hypothetical protein LIT37_22895 [Peribacillus asahii]